MIVLECDVNRTMNPHFLSFSRQMFPEFYGQYYGDEASTGGFSGEVAEYDLYSIAVHHSRYSPEPYRAYFHWVGILLIVLVGYFRFMIIVLWENNRRSYANKGKSLLYDTFTCWVRLQVGIFMVSCA